MKHYYFTEQDIMTGDGCKLCKIRSGNLNETFSDSTYK